MKIKRSTLVANRACDDGLEWFDNFVLSMGQEVDLEIEWDQLSMLWALSNPESKEWARWAIEKGVLPSWSLSEANLRGADLHGADLEGADLSGAFLQGAYYPTGPVPEGWRRTETGHLTKA